MRRIGTALAVIVGAWVVVSAVAVADEKVKILDACDPATFNATFGPGTCVDRGGHVTVQEFLSLNILPEGHPAWTNSPSYLTVEQGEKVKITNEGGETHTFTKVTAFGGGFIPELNLTESPIAPECASAPFVPNPQVVFIPTGGKLPVKELEVGTHLFQCCIHPWMRTQVKVEVKHDPQE
jgi:plastocyanin